MFIFNKLQEHVLLKAKKSAIYSLRALPLLREMGTIEVFGKIVVLFL